MERRVESNQKASTHNFVTVNVVNRNDKPSRDRKKPAVQPKPNSAPCCCAQKLAKSLQNSAARCNPAQQVAPKPKPVRTKPANRPATNKKKSKKYFKNFSSI